MTLVELVLEVHRHLDGAATSHAFGGALALAYVAEPRGTVDIDVNIFSPLAEIDTVLQVFAAIDLRPERSREEWVPLAGVRLRRDADPFPVDVFPSLGEGYAEIERRCERHPFGLGEDQLPFLSAEDLTVFKLSFGRAKDWVDIRGIATAEPNLDVAYIEAQLVGLRGPLMHPRIARLRSLLRAEHQ
ncbi:hypothetical protein BH23ACT1_BH23ACT1_02790 [soil metagenome]